MLFYIWYSEIETQSVCILALLCILFFRSISKTKIWNINGCILTNETTFKSWTNGFRNIHQVVIKKKEDLDFILCDTSVKISLNIFGYYGLQKKMNEIIGCIISKEWKFLS